jgi:hypothetical protein
MTVTELHALFLPQITHGDSKVFYMTQQGGPEVAQIQISVQSHDTETGTWDELFASLKGYKHHESKGEKSWPLFIKKDTV